MNANDAYGGSRQTSALTYIVVALIAAAAGFVAVYVSLVWDGNVAAPEPEAAQQSQASEEAPAGTSKPSPAAPPAAKTASSPLAGLNKGQVAGFLVRPEPQQLASFTFQDGEGAPKSMDDWKGKVVLVNLWATWCAPCRKEMPSLDRLKAQLGPEGFDVVAIATDRGDMEKPRAFLEEIGVQNLQLYHDPTAKLPSTLKAFGLPTSILLDRQGREIGRLVGPAEWDTPEAVALIEAAIAARPEEAG